MQVGVFPIDVKRMTLMSKVMVLLQIQCLPIHHAPIGQFLYRLKLVSLCLISTGKYRIHFLSTWSLSMTSMRVGRKNSQSTKSLHFQVTMQSWCKPGNPWDTHDPVSNKWISSKGAVIYKESMTIADKHRTVYYRPTKGDCSCQLFYDGQEDLLFNIDNRHLFYYGFLLQYLHNMVEGRNPLASYLHSCERTLATQSNTKAVKIKLLRQAWNCTSEAPAST